MGLFSKKPLVSDEYSDLNNKILKLSTEVSIIRAEFEKIEGRFKTLHTRINSVRIKDDDEQEETPQTDLAELQRQLLGFGNRNE